MSQKTQSILHLLRTGVPQYFMTGAIMSLGDFVSQSFVEYHPDHHDFDVMRNIRFGALGLFFAAPLMRIWFYFLDQTFGMKGTFAPLKKVITDQVIMSPALNCLTIITLEMMQFAEWSEIKLKLRSTLPDILVSNYKVWPMVQLINFYVISPKYRIMFIVSVGFFWNIYVASMLQSDQIILSTVEILPRDQKPTGH